MEYIEHEEVSYCTIFNLKLSQDEIEVYESCMSYVLENCTADEIYELTGCKVNELQAWQKNLKELMIGHVDEANLPNKYKS